jgi:hypothetical protein
MVIILLIKHSRSLFDMPAKYWNMFHTHCFSFYLNDAHDLEAINAPLALLNFPLQINEECTRLV